MKDSCGELRTQLIICKEIKLLPADTVNVLIEKTRKISAMLYNIIKVRKEKF